MTGARMPIYVANFVLMDYGTGAVMAVPAHDQRDFEFAKVYNLPLIPVVQPEGEPPLQVETMAAAYEGRGTMINSGEYDGMDSEEFKKVIAARFEKESKGGPTTHYRLRDWLISRQRFWGAPIPIVYCDKCGTVPVAEKDLPVALPAEVEFDVTGGSPLPKLDWWVNTKCPRCGGEAKRETDTMDTFVESSWYYERYASPHCATGPFDPKEVEYWLPVDQYIGGIEHAVLHLLYSRFYTKVLRDLGYVKYGEPFVNLLTQGMVLKESQRCPEHGYLFPEEAKDDKCLRCGKDVTVGRREKMSKSKKNVIDPEEMIKRYGADTLRLYLLFEAPPDKEIEWSEDRIQGVHRFINRVWAFAARWMEEFRKAADRGLTGADFASAPADMKDLYAKINRAVKDATERVNQWMFNTALASLMELLNDLSGFQPGDGPDREKRVALLAMGFERLVMLLNPFCPHLAEELWRELGYEIGTFKLPWPGYDPKALVKDTVEVVLQINGKVRSKISVPASAGQDELRAAALADPRVIELIGGKPVKKAIVVPGKLVNIVI
jgi:leucyl-tRNA synthetase